MVSARPAARAQTGQKAAVQDSEHTARRSLVHHLVTVSPGWAPVNRSKGHRSKVHDDVAAIAKTDPFEPFIPCAGWDACDIFRCREAAETMRANRPQEGGSPATTEPVLSFAPLAKWWPVALALIVCAGASWKVQAAQWDFEVYYFAAKASRAGLDPYATQSLAQVAGRRMPLPFVYPPAFLALFAPIAHLALGTAKTVYLVAKLAALAGLVLIWGCFCRNTRETLILLAIVVLGFSGTIFADIYAGNITCFEQLLVWLAVVALVTGHRLTFAVLIPLAAAVKGLPIALALLLLFEGRKAILPMLVSAGLFVVIEGCSRLMWPARTARFLALASGLDERGHSAPSILALLRDSLGPGGKAWVPLALYLTAVAFILGAFGFRAIRLSQARAWQKAPWFLLSGAFLSYILVGPRLKSYGFVLVVPVAAWLLARAKRGAWLMGTLVICLSAYAPLPKALLPQSPFWPLLWEYYALLCVFALWLLWWIEAKNISGLWLGGVEFAAGRAKLEPSLPHEHQGSDLTHRAPDSGGTGTREPAP
jgi:hypothetical protein